MSRKPEGTILCLRPRVAKHITPADRIGGYRLDQDLRLTDPSHARRDFEKVCAQAGVPELSLDEMRHTVESPCSVPSPRRPDYGYGAAHFGREPPVHRAGDTTEAAAKGSSMVKVLHGDTIPDDTPSSMGALRGPATGVLRTLPRREATVADVMVRSCTSF